MESVYDYPGGIFMRKSDKTNQWESLKFYLPPSQELKRLRPKIEAEGGKVFSKYSSGGNYLDVIDLAVPGQVVQGGYLYSSYFIDDCIQEGKLLDIQKYKMLKGQVAFERSMAQSSPVRLLCSDSKPGSSERSSVGGGIPACKNLNKTRQDDTQREKQTDNVNHSNGDVATGSKAKRMSLRLKPLLNNKQNLSNEDSDIEIEDDDDDSLSDSVSQKTLTALKKPNTGTSKQGRPASTQSVGNATKKMLTNNDSVTSHRQLPDVTNSSLNAQDKSADNSIVTKSRRFFKQPPQKSGAIDESNNNNDESPRTSNVQSEASQAEDVAAIAERSRQAALAAVELRKARDLARQTRPASKNSENWLRKYVEIKPVVWKNRSSVGRKKYTRAEDQEIIKLILKNKGENRVKSRNLWLELEVQVKRDRTWQSMRSRYLDIIAKSLNSYDLSAEDITKLEDGLIYGEGDSMINFNATTQTDFTSNAGDNLQPNNITSPEARDRALPVKHRKVKYTVEKDTAILRYILNNNKCSEVRGINMWKEMVDRKVIDEAHTWESIKSRYLRIVSKNLQNYSPTPSQTKRLLDGLNYGAHPKSLVDDDDDDDDDYDDHYDDEDAIDTEESGSSKPVNPRQASIKSTPAGKVTKSLAVQKPNMSTSKQISKMPPPKQNSNVPLSKPISSMPPSKQTSNILSAVQKANMSTRKQESNNSTSPQIFKSPGSVSVLGNIRQGRKKVMYNMEKDKQIIRFLLGDNWYTQVKGRAVWLNMVQNQVVNDSHTWQSLRSRYLDHIVQNLDLYDLDVSDIRKLRSAVSGSPKNQTTNRSSPKKVKPSSKTPAKTSWADIRLFRTASDSESDREQEQEEEQEEEQKKEQEENEAVLSNSLISVISSEDVEDELDKNIRSRIKTSDRKYVTRSSLSGSSNIKAGKRKNKADGKVKNKVELGANSKLNDVTNQKRENKRKLMTQDKGKMMVVSADVHRSFDDAGTQCRSPRNSSKEMVSRLECSIELSQSSVQSVPSSSDPGAVDNDSITAEQVTDPIAMSPSKSEDDPNLKICPVVMLSKMPLSQDSASVESRSRNSSACENNPTGLVDENEDLDEEEASSQSTSDREQRNESVCSNSAEDIANVACETDVNNESCSDSNSVEELIAEKTESNVTSDGKRILGTIYVSPARPSRTSGKELLSQSPEIPVMSELSFKDGNTMASASYDKPRAKRCSKQSPNQNNESNKITDEPEILTKRRKFTNDDNAETEVSQEVEQEDTFTDIDLNSVFIIACNAASNTENYSENVEKNVSDSDDMSCSFPVRKSLFRQTHDSKKSNDIQNKIAGNGDARIKLGKQKTDSHVKGSVESKKGDNTETSSEDDFMTVSEDLQEQEQDEFESCSETAAQSSQSRDLIESVICDKPCSQDQEEEFTQDDEVPFGNTQYSQRDVLQEVHKAYEDVKQELNEMSVEEFRKMMIACSGNLEDTLSFIKTKKTVSGAVPWTEEDDESLEDESSHERLNLKYGADQVWKRFSFLTSIQNCS